MTELPVSQVDDYPTREVEPARATSTGIHTNPISRADAIGLLQPYLF